MSKIKHLTEKDFKENTEDGISFVAFWATWCGPCRMMAPVYEEVADEMENLKVFKINTDENQELAVKYGIRSIPTMLIMKDGEVVDTLIGGNSKQVLKDRITKIL